jgi:nucleoid-associated protein YgaU
MRDDVKVAIVLVVLVISAALMYFGNTGPAPVVRVARLTPLYGEECLVGPEAPTPATRLAEPPSRSSSPTAASAEPSSGTLLTYVVQPGDTLSRLAVRFLGSEKYLDQLMAVNPGVDPRRLTVGQKLLVPKHLTKKAPQPVIPKPPEPKKEPPAPKPPREYQVQSGDSFTSIAKKLYGDPRKWEALFELNRDLVDGDPRHLRVGQVIRLPAESAETP